MGLNNLRQSVDSFAQFLIVPTSQEFPHRGSIALADFGLAHNADGAGVVAGALADALTAAPVLGADVVVAATGVKLAEAVVAILGHVPGTADVVLDLGARLRVVRRPEPRWHILLHDS